MLENLSNIIVLIASGLGAIVAALLGGLAIWTFRDIRSRSRDFLVQILATITVAVIPLGGILVYLMLRPRETLQEQYVRALEEESLLSSIDNQEFCPGCARRVEGDMRFCPSCHSKLRNECAGCKRAVHLSWDLCPYCGMGLKSELPQIKKAPTRQWASTEPHSTPQMRATEPKREALGEPTEAAAAAKSAQSTAADTAPSRSVGSMLDKLGGAVENMMNRSGKGDQ